MMNELARQINMNARAKGFWPSTGRNVGEVLMLIVSEAAEALEEYRNGHPIGLLQYEHKLPGANEVARTTMDKPDTLTSKPGKPVGFPSELADIIIRTLDLCGQLGIDIDEAIRVKMAYNATRPYRHGDKLA